jgi:MinD-like ATPase involved in chromosome partitioning or flagellar assembly/CheY-like chemotaxis protein
MSAISVLLVDDISSTLDNLRKLLSFEEDIEVVATAANGREAVEEAKKLGPDIILMDVNMPEMDGIQATEVLASEAPRSPVIIMSVQGERDYLRRAMQSGAREFLIKPFSGDELVASIRRVHQLEQRKEVYVRVPVPPGPAAKPVAAPGGQHQAAVAVAEAPAVQPFAADAVEAPVADSAEAAAVAEAPAADVAVAEVAPEALAAPGEAPATEAVVAEPEQDVAVAEAPAEAAEAAADAPAPEAEVSEEVAEEAAQEPPPVAGPPPRTNGEIFVLYGGKGGVGKSVIATNLACALANETGARVGLIDLDLQFGDIGVLLNLPQSQSISDLVENIGQVDPEFLYDSMLEGPAGIRVLPTAPSPELADLVTPEHVHHILEQARNIFDFVVVDTSSHMGDITLSALDMASRVLLITALSIPAVKNAKLALRLFETLSMPPEAITLVLNRCEAHTEFNKDSIESHLKFPISVQLPHDPRTVVNSINRGNPFVIASPETEASQRVRQLVALLLPEKAATVGQGAARRGLRFGRR